MSRSWLDQEATERKYNVATNPPSFWIVRNEYQQVKCPHCNEIQFCRLTRIWRGDPEKPEVAQDSEIHTNYNKSLDELKKLLIAYASEDINSGITEEHIEGKWKLILEGKVIGEEDAG